MLYGLSDKMSDVWNVVFYGSGILNMWDVGDVWILGMWDIGDVGCLGCGMLGMSYTRDVGCLGCSGCGMLEMWDVRDLGCLGCRIWDVGCLPGCGMLI